MSRWLRSLTLITECLVHKIGLLRFDSGTGNMKSFQNLFNCFGWDFVKSSINLFVCATASNKHVERVFVGHSMGHTFRKVQWTAFEGYQKLFII